MKKLVTICMACLASIGAMAGNGEGNCGIYLLVNGESQNYRLSSTDWKDNSITEALNGRSELKDATIGKVRTLVLCGGQMTAWANGNDYYLENSFRVQYRVYKQGETAPEEWQELALNEQTYRQNDDYRYEATGKTIDLLALTDGSKGTYVLEAKMLGHKYWKDGSNSGTFDTNHDPESTTFEIPSFYVVGDGSEGNAWCNEKSWEEGIIEANMIDANGSITFANVPAGTYSCKVMDGGWDEGHVFGYTAVNSEDSHTNVWSKQDGNITITTDAESDITVHFDIPTGKVTITSTLDRFVRTPYSVAGDPVLGLTWNAPETVDATMTRQEDGTYRYIKENIELEAHSGRQFRILGGYSWSTYAAPQEGDFIVVIPSNDTYDLIFDFDPKTHTATCTPKSHSSATGIDAIDAKHDGKYYDVLGRQVANPQRGSLYIRNGEKLIY